MESAKVLIVEDEGIVAQDLRRSLISMGYSVDKWATTGEEGVKIAEREKPDLVLMDIHLGKGINGVDAATEIREKFDTPVVFLTAYSDSPTLELAKQSQPYGYILKPFDENELRTNIEVALYKHRMERELKENRRFLSDLISRFPGFVYRCEAAGEMTLAFISSGIVKISGYSAEEIMDRSSGKWDDLRHPDDRDRVAVEIKKAVEGRRSFEIEYRILNRDGNIRWVLEKGNILEVKGALTLEGYVTDITQRKKTDEIQLRHQKLESIGRLAGGIAHEFNNYLMTVISGLYLIKDEAGRGTEISRKAEMLEGESERARLLTQRLLTFARGGQPLVGKVSVLPLLKETAKLVYKESKTVPVISAPADLWFAEADEGQIGQVFHVFLENAQEAMETGGTVRVKAENVEHSGDTETQLGPGKYIKITFRDSGNGVPAENVDKIFEPFFTTKASHSGLGLSAAYSIVKTHRGLITLDANSARGAAFSVYLPAYEKAQPEKEIPPVSEWCSGKRILIMDDEPNIQLLLREILTQMGFEVETTSKGEDAVRIYRERKEAGLLFDCVLLDLIVSAGMGGEEAAGLIRKFDPKARLIASSGYSKSPVMGNFKKSGFDAVLPKPYLTGDLERVLSRVLSEKR